MTAENKPHSIRTVGGRTELDQVQDEIDEAKTLLEEAHLDETLTRWNQKDKNYVEKHGMRPSRRKRERLQSNKDLTIQCIDFCKVTTTTVHAVLQRVPSDLKGETFEQHPRVLVATLC